MATTLQLNELESYSTSKYSESLVVYIKKKFSFGLGFFS